MQKKYIDFDDVIMATSKISFCNDTISLRKTYADDVEYVKAINWENLLEKSQVINDAFNIIKGLDDTFAILTRIHSMNNEGVAKVNYIRKNGIIHPIILVPYGLKKTDMVDAKNNILVDNTVFNCDDWASSGGIPFFFNEDGSDIDDWGYTNTRYPKVKTLEFLKKYSK